MLQSTNISSKYHLCLCLVKLLSKLISVITVQRKIVTQLSVKMPSHSIRPQVCPEGDVPQSVPQLTVTIILTNSAGAPLEPVQSPCELENNSKRENVSQLRKTHSTPKSAQSNGEIRRLLLTHGCALRAGKSPSGGHMRHKRGKRALLHGTVACPFAWNGNEQQGSRVCAEGANARYASIFIHNPPETQTKQRLGAAMRARGERGRQDYVEVR